jgi:anti-sigma factor RsiW
MQPDTLHATDDELQAWMDRELPPERTHWLDVHLSQCGDCAARLAGLQQDMSELNAELQLLDVSPPAVRAGTLAMRARGRRQRRWTMMAAASLFIGVAGIASAAPRSPVRQWLQAIAARFGLTSESVAPPSAPLPRTDSVPPAAIPATRSADASGVALVPGAMLRIVFDLLPTGGLVTVRMSDDPSVIVRAAPGTAVFRSGATELRVTTIVPDARFELQIPSSAGRVIVLEGRRTLLTKIDAVVRSAWSADSTGARRIPLGQVRPR